MKEGKTTVTRSLTRLRSAALATAVAVAVCVFAAAAHANLDGYFCGTPSSETWINVGSRCTHHVQHLFTRVSSAEFMPFQSDVMCALGKANSDGSGGNVTPPVCIQPYYSGNADSYCASGYTCLGYATIIHQSGNSGDYFYGHLWAVW